MTVKSEGSSSSDSDSSYEVRTIYNRNQRGSVVSTQPPIKRIMVPTLIRKVAVEKISANGYMPTKATGGAVGYDLYSAYDTSIESMENKLLLTDIKMAFPKGTYGRIAGRSGLALSNSIIVGGGVVDNDYIGNIGVILFNFGKTPFAVAKGDKIAQIIVEKYADTELIEAKIEKKTERNESGFGSSGVN